MSVISSSRSSGSSGPRPSSSFLSSSTRRPRSASVSRRPSSLRMSLMAAVTLLETIAGSRVSSFETSIVSNSLLWTLTFRRRELSAIASLRRRTVAPISEPPAEAVSGGRPPLVTLWSRSVSPILHTSSTLMRDEGGFEPRNECFGQRGLFRIRHYESCEIEHRARDGRRWRSLEEILCFHLDRFERAFVGRNPGVDGLGESRFDGLVGQR